ncbi:unnamed protein product [Choristocarpus tenellus]
MHRGPEFGIPPPWAENSVPARETIFDKLSRRTQGPVRCMVLGDYLARASADHPNESRVWTRCNCGYGREQDAVWAAMQAPAVPEQVTMKAVGYMSAGDMVRDAFAALHPSSLLDATRRDDPSSLGQEVRSSNGVLSDASTNPPPAAGISVANFIGVPDLLWVDFPCASSPFDMGRGTAFRDGKEVPGEGGNWRLLSEIDRALSELFERLPPDTLLVTVCQGSVANMLQLVSRKISARWTAKAEESGENFRDERQKSNKLFVPEDEDDLMRATEEAIHGVCFIAVK